MTSWLKVIVKHYLIFFVAGSEEVSQAAEQAPNASVFLLIQEFVKRAEELKYWLSVADQIIGNQFLGGKWHIVKTWHTLSVYLSTCDLSHLQEVLHWYSCFFFNFIADLHLLQHQDPG